MSRKNRYPPSVKPGIPKLGEKPSGWKRTTFGEILKVVERPVKLKRDQEYKLVVARRSRGGIELREVRRGKEVKTPTQFTIEEDDFLISKRQIIHGACGLVPASLSGAIVSNEYATLHPNGDTDIRFLQHFSHSTFFQQSTFFCSIGVDIEKMVFRLTEWLDHPVHMPPPEEQRRIAEILSTWDRAIEQTEKLIAAKERRKKALMQLLLTGKKRFKEFEGQEWQEGHFDDFVEVNPITRLEKGVSKVSFLEMAAVRTDAAYVDYLRKRPVQASGCNFQNADTLFAKITPCAENGKISFVDYLEEGEVAQGSTELIVLRPNPKKIRPSFLYHLCRSSRVHGYAVSNMEGTSGRKRIPPQTFRDMKCMLPPLKEQDRIISVLHEHETESRALHRQLAAIHRQKQGLMQVLLTGKKRVKVEEGNHGQEEGC